MKKYQFRFSSTEGLKKKVLFNDLNMICIQSLLCLQEVKDFSRVIGCCQERRASWSLSLSPVICRLKKKIKLFKYTSFLPVDIIDRMSTGAELWAQFQRIWGELKWPLVTEASRWFKLYKQAAMTGNDRNTCICEIISSKLWMCCHVIIRRE